MNNVQSYLVFPANEDYLGYAQDLVNANGGRFQLGEVFRKRFGSDEEPLLAREVYQNIRTQVEGEHVIVVGGYQNTAEIFPTYALCCQIVDFRAESLTMISPHMAYTTMERGVEPGDVVTFSWLANLLGSIPRAVHPNRLFVPDLHANGQESMFPKQNLRVRHVYLEELTLQAITDAGGDDFVVVSPDMGRSKWIESYATHLKRDYAVVHKKRYEEGPKALWMLGEVKDRDVVLCDDLVRSGSSIIEAAELCRRRGAKQISFVASHFGTVTNRTIERMKNATWEGKPLFHRVIVGETTPAAREIHRSGKYAGFFEARSVMAILASRVIDSGKNR